MGKGKIGTQTGTVIRFKRLKKIPCDCSKCRHSKKGAGTIYCSYFDIFSPKRKTCTRYWCVK